MLKISHYTEDPTLEEAELVESFEMADIGIAKTTARKISKYDGYVAIYAEDGEQIAGYKDGEQVQGY